MVFLSYRLNSSLSKTGGKINKRLPCLKIKFLQLCPCIEILFKKRTVHIHHWLTYTAILVITLTINAGYLDTLFSKGYLVGGIIQGLSFPDWKKFVIQKSSTA